MTTLLQLNTSIFSGQGQSTQLANEFVAQFVAQAPQTRVLVRDLASDPIPHLDAARFQAFLTEQAQRTPAQQAAVAASDALIAELASADVVVLTLPLYNFGIPSTLKAYFDQVARSKVTFRYTENGPEGLLKGKKVYVFATRGGQYAGTPRDTSTAYVRDFLAFLGMDEVTFVYAEGIAMGEAAKAQGLSEARSRIASLLETKPRAQASAAAA